MTVRLVYLVTVDWYFCSHRLPLAVAARDAGYQVSVVTQVGAHGERIRDHGLDLVPVRFPRAAGRPLQDLRVLASLPGIYSRLRPHLAHHVAIKPVLYGAAAAALARVPVTVNALAGLGYAFTGERALGAAMRLPLRLALRRASAWTILQNPEDRTALERSGLLVPERVRLIRGSGVDLERFVAHPEPAGDPVVVLASRLLWDKGVGEFVHAARSLRQAGVKARFVLVGEPDAENPAAVSVDALQAWQGEGVVEWWGRRDDMPAVLSGAHLFCLPSYREGMPKVLLEAAACGRAAVSTAVSGCRDAVHDGVTGLLVPPRNPDALAGALGRLIADASLRRAMGRAARTLAEAEFGVERVIAQTLALYEEALDGVCLS